jgi:hypothetical protein
MLERYDHDLAGIGRNGRAANLHLRGGAAAHLASAVDVSSDEAPRRPGEGKSHTIGAMARI